MLIAPKSPKEAERIKALHDLNILDTPINPVFERITRLTKTMFDVPIVAISIIDSERQWFKSTQGLNVCQNDLQTSFCSHTILQDDILLIPDASKDDRFADNPCVLGDLNIRFYAGCPVKNENGYKVGTLCIIDNKPRDIDKDKLSNLKDMAILVEEELQKYKQKYKQSKIIQELDQAKRAKLIDSLTGVWNREGAQINLDEQILLAKSQHHKFIVAIYDIDNFKRVNDTFGHNAGDDVIREVCKRVVLSLEDQDIVGRWGGEEFIIIAQYSDTYGAVLQKIEQARKNVCAEPVVSGGSKINVSITIGVITYDGAMDATLQEIVAKADEALYEGKNSGKNKCVIR